jgi:hypothetical protein
MTLDEALKERDEARADMARLEVERDSLGATVARLTQTEAVLRAEQHAFSEGADDAEHALRARAEAAEVRCAMLREALEACGYWLHPAGFNAERQRLFDRITEGVANSHSLWNFIRARIGNTDAEAARWLEAHDAKVRAAALEAGAIYLEERAVTFRRAEDRAMYACAAHDLRFGLAAKPEMPRGEAADIGKGEAQPAASRPTVAALTEILAPVCATCGGTGDMPMTADHPSRVWMGTGLAPKCTACGGSGKAVPK